MDTTTVTRDMLPSYEEVHRQVVEALDDRFTVVHMEADGSPWLDPGDDGGWFMMQVSPREDADVPTVRMNGGGNYVPGGMLRVAKHVVGDVDTVVAELISSLTFDIRAKWNL